MVTDETFDGKSIFSIVSVMQLIGIFSRKAEMVFEKLVCCKSAYFSIERGSLAELTYEFCHHAVNVEAWMY